MITTAFCLPYARAFHNYVLTIPFLNRTDYFHEGETSRKRKGLAMPKLADERHEQFARLVAEGVGQFGAYREVFGTVGAVAASVPSNLARRPRVAARIAELQEELAGEAVWALTERLEYLRDVAMTPYHAVDATSPLCLGTRHTRRGVEHRTPDKLDALALYCRLAGDLRPDAEAEAQGPSPIYELVRAIRSGNLEEAARIQQELEEMGAWTWRGHSEEDPSPEEPVRVAQASPSEPARKPNEPLANARHERFAHHVARGETYTGALIKVYHVTREVALGCINRIAHRPEVRERIAELRARAAQSVSWTIPQRLLYLKRLVLTPLEQVTLGSRYCQGIWRYPKGLAVRMPNKLRAIELYSRLAANLNFSAETSRAGVN